MMALESDYYDGCLTPHAADGAGAVCAPRLVRVALSALRRPIALRRRTSATMEPERLALLIGVVSALGTVTAAAGAWASARAS